MTIDADLREVTVTPAPPGERTGDLAPVTAALTTPWREAVQEALARAAIFKDESHNHVNLEVKILKLDIPSVGLTFPVEADARYTIVDRATGAVLFSKVVSSHGSTPADFAFRAVERARESVSRAGQSNIAGLVYAVEHSPQAVARVRRPES